MHPPTVCLLLPKNGLLYWKQGIFLSGDVFEIKAGSKNEIMDLPVVKKYFPMAARINEEAIMRLENRISLLSQVNSGKGKLFLSAVPLNTDFSGLPVHALLFRLCIGLPC
jgi:hypothetical protein